ncbi:hypothetical protein D3C71_1723170 [compost metagenome]
MEYARHLIQHAVRQVTAVGAWVSRCLVGLIQGLGHRQGLLGAKAKLSRADLLQRAQVERQRRTFAHALDLDAADMGSPLLA